MRALLSLPVVHHRKRTRDECKEDGMRNNDITLPSSPFFSTLLSLLLSFVVVDDVVDTLVLVDDDDEAEGVDEELDDDDEVVAGDDVEEIDVDDDDDVTADSVPLPSRSSFDSPVVLVALSDDNDVDEDDSFLLSSREVEAAPLCQFRARSFNLLMASRTVTFLAARCSSSNFFCLSSSAAFLRLPSSSCCAFDKEKVHNTITIGKNMKSKRSQMKEGDKPQVLVSQVAFPT
jgi:hypothetical protein